MFVDRGRLSSKRLGTGLIVVFLTVAALSLCPAPARSQDDVDAVEADSLAPGRAYWLDVEDPELWLKPLPAP